MMRAMRSALALVPARDLAIDLTIVMAITACGGHGGVPADPSGARAAGPVRLVRCRPAPPLPSLGGDPAALGSLLGSGTAMFGSLEAGEAMIGVLRAGPPAVDADAPPKRGAVVVVGEPAVTGSLAAPAIAAVLRPRAAELAACVARAPQLLEAGATKTRVVVEWRLTVGAGGKVIQADPAARELSPPIEACVTGVVRGAAFPAPPDGHVVAVKLPIAFDATGAAPEAPEVEATAAWTPFAQDATEAASASEQAARAAEGAVRGRLAAIDACFAGSAATGSLRAVLAVDIDGALTSARAGGLGDKAAEACVENALTGLRVVLPSSSSGELACDLSRGDAQPWRLTLDRGGYGVVEVSRTRVRYGDQSLSLGEEPDTLSGHSVFALVADADAPGALLALAMRWTSEADATLVALRAAGAAGAGGPPLLLGAGRTAAAEDQTGEGEESRPLLELGGGALTACTGRWRQIARLADPSAIDGAVQKLAARCRERGCSPSLVIAADRDAAARELAQAAGAARRAGFERVLFVPGVGQAAAGEEPAEPADGVSCPPRSSDDRE